ncbi:conjugative transposon protein TraM [Sphingobacterium sp. PCS056]|uniref:conjugative transposon protein TraM n=1 Tax=Sphingobacterium sp. PCS056 TaxID=2931400 RepID=UPI00200D0C81|nr:conjugative transposon protein TraM [Sphingobacterium sp. PCS056]UPZ36475.1 conjugative transposon protein TraM [Sphingobacterium sp. PCS056]
MEKQVKTAKEIKKRKFLLMLPILVLPFLTAFFWALGGGRDGEVTKGEDAKQAGLNSMLPDANLKEDRVLDKMGYYDQAHKDSAKFEELMKNDPNYQMYQDEIAGKPYDYFGNPQNYSGLNRSLNGRGNFNNPNEENIYRKLAELNNEINRPAVPGGDVSGLTTYRSAPLSGYSGVNSSDIDRLEQMMGMMGQSGGEDQEITQLNGMLEKILDIQHPDRVQDKLKQKSQQKKGQVYPVRKVVNGNNISLLQAVRNTNTGENGFYSLDKSSNDSVDQNAIPAVIHDNQVLVNGSTVKLRLTEDVQINGVVIPKGNFLFGIASLNGERLGIGIDNIRYGNSIYPVELTVFDIDGLDGIYIPGAISRDVAKESADRSLQNIGLTSLDPSIGMQAAGFGIEAVKSLTSKKVKLVKVTVKAGYLVLLRDEKQKQSLTN